MINQKVTIVTAASRGIGAAICRLLAKNGHKLIIMSRSDDIYPLADELSARPIQGSITDHKSMDKLVEFAMGKYGRIDSVVFNTGHAQKGNLLEISDKEWEDGFELLLLSFVKLMKKIAPVMKKQKSGSIVSISTFASKEPSLSFPVSSVVRSALLSFTKLAAEELGSYNIRVNSVLPGYIDTYPAGEDIINDIPLLQQGEPKDVAELVNFLISDSSAYITGQNILLDGGLNKSI